MREAGTLFQREKPLRSTCALNMRLRYAGRKCSCYKGWIERGGIKVGSGGVEK